jgi:hypothetical protein
MINKMLAYRLTTETMRMLSPSMGDLGLPSLHTAPHIRSGFMLLLEQFLIWR